MKYLNKKLYTDVTSFGIFDIDEEKGTAKAIIAEKHPKFTEDDYEVGGFCAHFHNLNEKFRDAPVEYVGEAFDIQLRNGYWGRWENQGYWLDKRFIEPEYLFKLRRDGAEEKNGNIFVAEKTITGKQKKVFVKLGKNEDLCDECRYFYDYNF